MDWGDDVPARTACRAKALVERALDKAVLLDTERSSTITDSLIMLLTEIEELLNGNDPFDFTDNPDQLELDLPEQDEER